MFTWLCSLLYLTACLNLISAQSLANGGRTNLPSKNLGVETSGDTISSNGRTFGGLSGGLGAGNGGGLFGDSLFGRLVGALFRPAGGETNYYRPPPPYAGGYPPYGAYPPPYGGYHGYPGYGPGPYYG
uniref:Uncharacterized protein n=1 Tax=Glossina morsitans morsitans TaxID=37546 RepID=A0A1B0GAK7_GLOMM